MKNIRKENDFAITWEIQINGAKVDLSTVIGLKVEIKDCVLHPIQYQGVRDGKIYLEPFADRAGIFSAVAEFDLPDNTLSDGMRHIKVDTEAFKVVERSSDADKSFDTNILTNIFISKF